MQECNVKYVKARFGDKHWEKLVLVVHRQNYLFDVCFWPTAQFDSDVVGHHSLSKMTYGAPLIFIRFQNGLTTDITL